MLDTALKYGLRSGGILSALMVLTIGGPKLLGIEVSHGIGAMVIGYTTMVLSGILIYVGIRSYRDTVLQGRVRFWPALRLGLLIGLIASACYAATWQVVYRSMLPDFAEKYGEQAVKQAQDRGAPAAEVDKIRTEMAKFAVNYKNPFYNFAMTLLEPAPVVMLVALFSAGLLSRKRREHLPSLGAALS